MGGTLSGNIESVILCCFNIKSEPSTHCVPLIVLESSVCCHGSPLRMCRSRYKRSGTSQLTRNWPQSTMLAVQLCCSMYVSRQLPCLSSAQTLMLLDSRSRYSMIENNYCNFCFARSSVAWSASTLCFVLCASHS